MSGSRRVCLLVTWNSVELTKQMRGASKSIKPLIEGIPTVAIERGDPRSSLKVRVDADHEQELRTAVNTLCVVEAYREIEL
jgi:hypothetical protein